MSVITISRQYGSGGDEVASRVCELLGYQLFDKRMIECVATELGYSPEEAIDYSEDLHEYPGRLRRWFSRPRPVGHIRVWREDAHGVRVEDHLPIHEDQANAMVRAAIRLVYQHGNVVIVGRGGQVVLRGKPDVLHVRIEALYENRLRRIQALEGVGQVVAREMIARRDEAAADYIRRFYEEDWRNPELYDLVLNTDLFGIEGCAQKISQSIQKVEQSQTRSERPC